MKLIVQDASILIDLTVSETVDAWFACGIETWTTNLIYPFEIDRTEQRAVLDAYVEAQKLRIHQMTPDQIESLKPAQAKLGRGLSLPDISVFLLAQEFGPNAVLATGDKALRSTADRERIKACGILGLFECMIESREGRPPVLPLPVAIQKLRAFMRNPSCRIPADKCEERIRSWSAK